MRCSWAASVSLLARLAYEELRNAYNREVPNHAVYVNPAGKCRSADSDLVSAVTPLPKAYIMLTNMVFKPYLLMIVMYPAGECSSAVAALVSLIAPLPYSADFRPYFVIHDPTFMLLSRVLPSNANSLPRLLGTTNVYFIKVCFPSVSAMVLRENSMDLLVL